MGFEVFPERCNRETVSYLEGERVPKNWGVVTERVGKVFWFIYELYGQKWGYEVVSGIASIFMVDYSSIFPTDDWPIIDFFTPLLASIS